MTRVILSEFGWTGYCLPDCGPGAREQEEQLGHEMVQMIEIIDDELTGHVVNVQHIVAITGNNSGDQVLLLSTGREIKLHESEDIDMLLGKIQGLEE
ncbi:hypothetical protein KBY25_07360 [Ruegeria pomeroyi]|nr:hypothetical protein [Ruegeria pomeroyi]